MERQVLRNRHVNIRGPLGRAGRTLTTSIVFPALTLILVILSYRGGESRAVTRLEWRDAHCPRKTETLYVSGNYACTDSKIRCIYNRSIVEHVFWLTNMTEEAPNWICPLPPLPAFPFPFSRDEQLPHFQSSSIPVN
jgi:hypothetical protein